MFCTIAVRLFHSDKIKIAGENVVTRSLSHKDGLTHLNECMPSITIWPIRKLSELCVSGNIVLARS